MTQGPVARFYCEDVKPVDLHKELDTIFKRFKTAPYQWPIEISLGACSYHWVLGWFRNNGFVFDPECDPEMNCDGDIAFYEEFTSNQNGQSFRAFHLNDNKLIIVQLNEDGSYGGILNNYKGLEEQFKDYLVIWSQKMQVPLDDALSEFLN